MSATEPRPTRALASEYLEALRELGACPHCGRALAGTPNRCPHCGKLLGDAAHDLKGVAAEERRLLARRKNVADLLFLAGLLGGGPLLALGERAGLGLFVLLAGGVASAMYRWTRSSLGGSLVIASLGAAAIGVAVAQTADAVAPEDAQVHAAARGAYAAALARAVEDTDGIVEARGPGLITIWFQLPLDAACGSYPDEAVRRHLAELGFARVVVAARVEGAGVCSFAP